MFLLAWFVSFAYLVLLELAEGPDGPQVPAGAAAIGEGVDDQIHVCQTFLVWRRLPHGGGRVRNPGAPVVLHSSQTDEEKRFNSI